MRPRQWVLPFIFAISTVPAHAGIEDPLAGARLLYNQRKFEAAVSAAERVHLDPSRADSADLVAARSYLERFRSSGASDDLTNARERLRRLNPDRFGPLERAEFIVGLGEALYFDQSFGAAATIFASALDAPDVLTMEARDRVLDWWASASDRECRPRADVDRQSTYERIHARMEKEIAAYPGSTTAAYWLAASAAGKGDSQAAWDAAEAGWARAPLTTDGGMVLRADLDRLVLRAIVPERARLLAQSPDALRLEWERFKEKWKR
jgi:hypothetical protein